MILVLGDDPAEARLMMRATKLLEQQMRVDGDRLPAGLRQVRFVPMPGNESQRQQATRPAVEQPVSHADDMEKALLTYDETAPVLNISGRTVGRLVKSGDLPAVAIGRRKLIRRADLDRYIDELGS